MYPSVEDYSPTESIPSGGKAGEPSVFVSWKCAQFLFAQKNLPVPEVFVKLAHFITAKRAWVSGRNDRAAYIPINWRPPRTKEGKYW